MDTELQMYSIPSEAEMDRSVKKNGEKIKHGADNSNNLTSSEENNTNTNTNTNTNSNDNHHRGRSQTQPPTQPRRTLTNIDSQFSDSNQTGQTPITAFHALNGNQLTLTASHYEYYEYEFES